MATKLAKKKKLLKKKVFSATKKKGKRVAPKRALARRTVSKAVVKKPISKKPAPRPVAVKSNIRISKKVQEMNIRAERLLAKGRERGYVTYDQILREFQKIEEDVIFLEDLYERLTTASVDVLEGGGMLEEKTEEDLLDKKNI